MTQLHVVKPGLHTLIQDTGRPGYQAFGVPLGGALDRTAARQANWLLDNPENTPVLEITLLGPQIRITGAPQIAITGADMSPTINGQAVPMYQTIQVPDDAILSFGALRNGCRAYLGVRGQWNVPTWLHSASAVLPQHPHCTPQSFLYKGQVLTIQTKAPIPIRTCPTPCFSKPNTPVSVRTIPGPEFDFFSPLTIASFYGRTQQVSPDSNRMGYRLTAALDGKIPDSQLISSGIVPGTIQIPASGKPIVLLADAQTTGGYHRIAHVIQADLDLFGQLKPGDTIRFSLVTLHEAVELSKYMDVR